MIVALRRWWLSAVVALLPALGLTFAFVAGWQHDGAAARLGEVRQLVDDQRDRLASMAEPPVAAPVATPSLLGPVPDLAGTMREIEAAAVTAQAGLTNARPQPATVPGQQDFVLTGRARPANLCALLAALENSRRLLTIDAGRIEAVDVDVVQYEFTVASFHQLEAGR